MIANFSAVVFLVRQGSLGNSLTSLFKDVAMYGNTIMYLI